MVAAGFARVPRAPYVWRYDAAGRTVDLEIAGVASSTEPEGPFWLLAAVAGRRRRARDLADVQSALETFAGRAGSRLSVPAMRARLRGLYGLQGQRLQDLI